MAKNISGLKRGGPGRPKGVPNKATRDIQAFSREMLEDPEYVQSLRERLIEGRAPHMETLLAQYGYGKPKDTMVIEGQLPPFVLKIEPDEPTE